MTANPSPTRRVMWIISYICLIGFGWCAIWTTREAVSPWLWWMMAVLVVAGSGVSWLQRVGRLPSPPGSVMVSGMVLSVAVPAMLVILLSMMLQAGILLAMVGVLVVRSWSLCTGQDEIEWQTVAAVLLVYGSLVSADVLLEAQVVLVSGVLMWLGYAASASAVAWFDRSTTIVSLNDEIDDVGPSVARLAILLGVSVALSVAVGASMAQWRQAVPMMWPSKIWRAVEKNLADYYSHFSPVGLREHDQVERITDEEARLNEELRALEEATAKPGQEGDQGVAQMVPQRLAERTAWIGPVTPREPTPMPAQDTDIPDVDSVSSVQQEEDELQSAAAGGLDDALDAGEEQLEALDPDTGTRQAAAASVWWVWLAIVGATLLLPLGVWWIWSVRQRGMARADARQHVVSLYQELLRCAAWCNDPKPPPATPTEFAAAVCQRWSEVAVAMASMTELFHEAKYSAHPITDQHVERATAAYLQLKPWWLSHATWWRRWMTVLVIG